MGTHEDRRDFLKSIGRAGLTAVGMGTLAGGTLALGADSGFMSPNEDLMQEHALLNRVQLMYDEAIRRLKGGIELDPNVLQGAAAIIRHFVEEYHEKLEETYVFPRFEKAGKLVDLVSVLRIQHKAGRVLTDTILSLSTLSAFRAPAQREQLIAALSAFVRMYRPHEAREGSVLFPAFRDLVPPKEFADLGELFEKKEHELLGAEGFEGQVGVAAELEKQMGIYDLAQFTPKKS
jgi:hemerythrin-like domain-containing protein